MKAKGGQKFLDSQKEKVHLRCENTKKKSLLTNLIIDDKKGA